MEAHRVELATWVGCALVAIGVVLHTLAADFESRSLALTGEATTLTLVVLLALASLRRAARSKQSPRSQIAGVTLRVAFGVPVFVFALVVSASGFAA